MNRIAPTSRRLARAVTALVVAGLMLCVGATPAHATTIDCTKYETYDDVVPRPLWQSSTDTMVRAAGYGLPLQRAEYATFCLVNDARVANHLTPYSWTDQLSTSAYHHTYDVIRNHIHPGPPGTYCLEDPNPYFSWDCGHRGSDGSWPEDRIWKSGYCSSCQPGETGSWGYATPRQVVSGWMGDKPHRDTVLSTKLKATGIDVDYGTWDGESNAATYFEDYGA